MENTRDIHKNPGLGSYYWGGFRDNSSELIRLKKQASMGIEFEMNFWKSIPINEDSAILDVGCGPGVISSAIAKFASKGTVVGIDKNSLMIKECKENKEYEAIKNLSFREGDIYNLDIPENSVDVIYSRFLFQHLSNPIQALNQLKKVLKPGGKVCIIDVDDSWLTLNPRPALFESYLRRVEDAQKDMGGDRFVGHKLKDYFEEVGFINVKSKVEMITSCMININDLLDMIINYKYQLVKSDDMEVAEKERASILKLSENEFAWGAVGLFFTTGQKSI